MALETQHNNYLFVGKKHCDFTLLNKDVFPLIMDAVNPLLSFTNIKKCRITAHQIANTKTVKFGRPRWSKEGLMPIIQNYEQYTEEDDFHFLHLVAEFPSVVSAYNRKETVDIYIYLENDLFWGKAKSDGDCGLFLSLRNDIYENTGENLVMQVLKQLSKLFDEVKILTCQRTWWSKSKNEESALQDVCAWRVHNKQYSKNYSNWKEITFK